MSRGLSKKSVGATHIYYLIGIRIWEDKDSEYIGHSLGALKVRTKSSDFVYRKINPVAILVLNTCFTEEDKKLEGSLPHGPHVFLSSCWWREPNIRLETLGQSSPPAHPLHFMGMLDYFVCFIHWYRLLLTQRSDSRWTGKMETHFILKFRCTASTVCAHLGSQLLQVTHVSRGSSTLPCTYRFHFIPLLLSSLMAHFRSTTGRTCLSRS